MVKMVDEVHQVCGVNKGFLGKWAKKDRLGNLHPAARVSKVPKEPEVPLDDQGLKENRADRIFPIKVSFIDSIFILWLICIFLKHRRWVTRTIWLTRSQWNPW